MCGATEHCVPCRTVLVDECSHLIDRADAVRVAFALRRAPCEEPVAAENQSVGARVVPHGRFDEKRELEARALPWYPDDVPIEAPVEFFELLPAVRRRRER